MVSVIIPVYNQEKYILKCLYSIINQPYDDYEIIIIDDGSTDRSADICRNIIRKYTNKIHYYFQKNQGVSSARNKGILYARGDWITFVDPDDYIMPNYFKVLLAQIDDEVDIIAASCFVHCGKTINTESFYKRNRIYSTTNNKLPLFYQLMCPQYGQETYAYTAIGVPWAKLYRTEFIKKNDLIFNPNLVRMQDNVFNMHAFYLSKKIKYTNSQIYVYRYEHLKKWKCSYKSYLYSTFMDLIKERKVFLESSKLMSVGKIRSFYIQEVISIYSEIICNNMINNAMSFRNEYRELRRICNEDVIREACKYSCHIYWYNNKHRIIYYLVKFKMYRIVYLLVKLKLFKDRVFQI